MDRYTRIIFEIMKQSSGCKQIIFNWRHLQMKSFCLISCCINSSFITHCYRLNWGEPWCSSLISVFSSFSSFLLCASCSSVCCDLLPHTSFVEHRRWCRINSSEFSGVCGSGGGVGHQLMGKLVIWSLPPRVCMLKHWLESTELSECVNADKVL